MKMKLSILLLFSITSNVLLASVESPAGLAKPKKEVNPATEAARLKIDELREDLKKFGKDYASFRENGGQLSEVVYNKEKSAVNQKITDLIQDLIKANKEAKAQDAKVAANAKAAARVEIAVAREDLKKFGEDYASFKKNGGTLSEVVYNKEKSAVNQKITDLIQDLIKANKEAKAQDAKVAANAKSVLEESKAELAAAEQAAAELVVEKQAAAELAGRKAEAEKFQRQFDELDPAAQENVAAVNSLLEKADVKINSEVEVAVKNFVKNDVVTKKDGLVKRILQKIKDTVTWIKEKLGLKKAGFTEAVQVLANVSESALTKTSSLSNEVLVDAASRVQSVLKLLPEADADLVGGARTFDGGVQPLFFGDLSGRPPVLTTIYGDAGNTTGGGMGDDMGGGMGGGVEGA